ncbi:MAG: hypothetical protein ACI9MR_000301 [Myxococcota bacterium]|jgi:hypothetical protein
MRTVLCLAALVAILGVGAGCEAKATPEECAAACKQVETVFLGSVDKKLAEAGAVTKLGESGAQMADDLAQQMLKYLRTDCESRCNSLANQSQVECLKGVKTPDDLKKCR